MRTAITLKDVTRSFGATRALRGVSFDLAPGEIHALVGENGAGKSTLMNILSGVLQPDGGSLYRLGAALRLSSPQEAAAQGIATVFQELSLVEGLSIAENICATRAPQRLGLIDRRAMRQRAERALARLGSALAPDRAVESLLANERQMVEIAKAFDHLTPGGVLILDEPTSALNAAEKQALFAAIRHWASEGVGIIYISHHLDEVRALADRVTVLRDGASVWTRPAAGLGTAEIVRAMVGRAVSGAGRARRSGGEVLAEARAVTVPGRLQSVSVRLHRGEILGLAGLEGSGREALARVLAGVLSPSSGTLLLGGRPHPGQLRLAMRQGLAYVPDDRKGLGLFLDLSIAANALAADLGTVTQRGLIRSDQMQAAGAAVIAEFGVKARDPGQAVGALSGGNQQKVLFAKWLRRNPGVLIVEEPTKGVDIGAKTEIHDRLAARAAGGAAVLVASSDLPELLEISDRILVMRQGAVAGILGPDASEEEVMILAAGG